MTTEAVKNYLAQFFAVADKEIDKTEIELLAAAWGLSTEQVAKYLDFVDALKDSKLSPEEINALQEKWGGTVGEIQKYSDFVLKVRDFKITDAEVKDLGSAWGLSNTQVLAYLENIGIPFDYKGQFIDPVNGIGVAWQDTTGAVGAYIDSVGDADTALATLTANAKSNANVVEAAFNTATDAADALATAGNAALDIAKAAQAAAEGAIATAGAASAAAKLATALAEGARAAAEAAAAAALLGGSGGSSLPIPIPPGSSNDGNALGFPDYDVSGIATGPSGGNTINITVTGSVIAQDDLVATVRDGLLAGIGSGAVTTFDPQVI
jgi:hypothetical protein